jgi:hypothetical protein
VAVGYHGYPRFTADMDVWVDPGSANLKRLTRALESFGFGSSDIAKLDFHDSEKIVKIGTEPYRIDLLMSIPGVRFDRCVKNCVRITIQGICVPVIGLADLKKNKKATGRPQDIVDLNHLSSETKKSARISKRTTKH